MQLDDLASEFTDAGLCLPYRSLRRLHVGDQRCVVALARSDEGSQTVDLGQRSGQVGGVVCIARAHHRNASDGSSPVSGKLDRGTSAFCDPGTLAARMSSNGQADGDAAELDRLRALVGPNEADYEAMRTEMLNARDEVKAAEAHLGELRGQIAELESKLHRARQDQFHIWRVVLSPALAFRERSRRRRR